MARATPAVVRAADRKRLLWLCGAGLLTEIVYLLALGLLPLWRYYDVPLLDLGKLAGHAPGAGVAYLLAVALLFGVYLLALQVMADPGDSRLSAVVLGFAIAFSLTLFFVYPWGAADLYDYIVGGQVLARGQNPFQTAGIQVLGEPWSALAPWADTPSGYGPIWALLAGGIAAVAGDGVLANVLAFKGLALASFWALVLLLTRLSREEGWDAPGRALLFLAWNPLILLETVANGHNDALMMVLVVLALLLLARKRTAGAYGALAAAVLFKFVALLLLPAFLLQTWQHGQGRARLGRLATAVLAFAIPLLLISAPFWQARDAFALGRRFQMFTTSLPALILAAASGWLAPFRAMSLAHGIGWGLFVTLAAYRLARMGRGMGDLVRVSHDLLYGYLVLAAAWVQSWYVAWLVPLSAGPVGEGRAQRTHLLAISALVNYFLFFFLWFLPGLRQIQPVAFRALAGVAFLLPQAALGLWQVARGARRPKA